MGVKLSTLERVDLTRHGTELGLHTVQGHFPHLAWRDLVCLLFCARTEATEVARGQTHSPGQRFAELIVVTDRDHGQFAAAVCTARTLRGALLTVAAGKHRHSIIANEFERQAIADALQNIGILNTQSNQVRLPNQER